MLLFIWFLGYRAHTLALSILFGWVENANSVCNGDEKTYAVLLHRLFVDRLVIMYYIASESKIEQQRVEFQRTFMPEQRLS